MSELTTTDLQILDALQEDASLTTQQVADRINISQSPCWRRINRLEEDGLIEKRVSILNREKLGMEVVPVELRDAYAFGGGLHCCTADVYREGGCEDYFPSLG